MVVHVPPRPLGLFSAAERGLLARVVRVIAAIRIATGVSPLISSGLSLTLELLLLLLPTLVKEVRVRAAIVGTLAQVVLFVEKLISWIELGPLGIVLRLDSLDPIGHLLVKLLQGTEL